MIANEQQYEFLLPMVTGWLGKVSQAVQARKEFDDVARQCEGFFSGATGFMWEEAYRGKYLGGVLSPRFKITLAKAFELVALFGPTLYWQNPQRSVRPRPQIQWTPDVFGDPEDPESQMLFQMAQMEQQQRMSEDAIRSQLLEQYLNYTPDEQPGGGLARQAELALTESLVAGRGVLWLEPYRMPGSSKTLTGGFWGSHKYLLVDPDAKSFDQAWWIARMHVEPAWQVERRFQLPKDTVKSTLESATARGEGQSDEMREFHRSAGKTNDLCVWYEIFSKMGVGARLVGVTTPLKEAFDRVVGDFAYLAISPGTPYPLNAPQHRVRQADDESVRRMFRWPAEYWKDRRWPCAVLDYYEKPNSAWPIAPLAPGLGELTYMNVFISHIAARVWSSSRDFIAVLESASKYVESELKSGQDLSIIKLPQVHKDISSVVQFLQQPQMNADVWKVMEAVMDMFERRVGLNEILYGLNPGGVQSRTATDFEGKRQMATIRIDFMGKKVENWMTEVADMEKFAASWFVRGRDVEGLFGQVGAGLWDRYISAEDPEEVVRQMRANVEANSARKPNKQRDAQNINTVLPVLFPELSKHADVTTDTTAINALIRQWGEAIEQPTGELMLGPRTPAPPPPEIAEAQQQMQEAEQAKQQAELEKKQLEVQGKMIDLEGKREQSQEALLKSRMELLFGQAKHEQELGQSEDAHEQELDQDAETHDQEIEQTWDEHELKMVAMEEENAEKLRAAKQQRRLQAEAKSNGSKQ